MFLMIVLLRHRVELMIQPFLFHELLMCTAFFDDAVIQDKDLVSILDRKSVV